MVSNLKGQETWEQGDQEMYATDRQEEICILQQTLLERISGEGWRKEGVRNGTRVGDTTNPHNTAFRKTEGQQLISQKKDTRNGIRMDFK
jgi:hypothetical protein